ncbi:6-bladed beta-propeller [Gemmatimonadota bacterium]
MHPCGLVLLFSVIIITGCSASDTGPHSFSVTEENGIPVAVTSGGPRYDTPPFGLEEVLRIHQNEDQPASLLRSPTDLAPGPDGTLIVVERNIGRAVVYDADGEFIRELGGRGQGPGEFESIQDMRISGDTLSFYDWRQYRLTVLRIDGTLIEVLPTRDYGRIQGIDMLPGRILALRDSDMRFGRNHIYQSSSIVVINEATGDTLSSLKSDDVEISPNDSPGGGTGTTVAIEVMPFTAEASTMVIPGDRILVTAGVSPEIDLYDLSGRLLRSIRIELPARQVTPEMKDEYWAGAEMRLAHFNRELDPTVKADTPFPTHAGWWAEVIADETGYLWMRDVTSNPAGWPGIPSRFFVLDPEGCYLGVSTLPAMTGRIENGRYYTIVRDLETGLYEPVVYRIVPLVSDLTYP